MPSITINGKVSEFKPGQMILQVANQMEVAVPQYCYHDGLSIVASCRICLAEVWMPNPKNGGKLEPYMGGKLLPTCQTACMDGMVVYTDSPKSVANQKAVMEYLLINHPLDCPVCDQAGECLLQDYSYEYGRGESRFEETKVKQAKKDVGPHVYLYADRCIMCTRCVRFTREVAGTAELLISGRGNREEIDVFPGKPLDNPLSANVVDLCPVGALLDKDFLFAQRVWYLKSTPSIDPLTASGDNIYVEHNKGQIYRVKPRENMAANKWWITDEVRYGWKFVHDERRLAGANGGPRRKQFGVQVEAEWARASADAAEGLAKVVAKGKRVALIASPMISCEDAYSLAQAAMTIDPQAFLALGPIPVSGQDQTYPPGKADGFKVFAEKCPNSRGVKRVLGAVSSAGAHNGYVASFEQIIGQLRSGEVGGVIVTGNFPSAWVTPELEAALKGAFVVLADTLASSLSASADVLLPAATWAEKAGTFESARGALQAFEQAIEPLEGCRSEGQIGLDLLAAAKAAKAGKSPASSATPAAAEMFNAANIRQRMAAEHGELGVFVSQVVPPSMGAEMTPDMEMVEL